MKNLEKKIICVFASLVLVCCCFASMVALVLKRDLNKAVCSSHPFNSLFFGIYGVTNNAMQKKFIYNSEASVYKLKNGFLSYKKDKADTTAYEKQLKDFNTFLTQKGINYNYIITAEAGDERLGQLPYGVETNYCEESTNILKGVLERNNIKYLDTYETLINADGNYYDYFYKTDHHWNDYAGLLVSEAIANKLNSDYNMNLDASLFDVEKYEKHIYQSMFLGSCGKKIGLGYVPLEDFDLLLPKFETNFEADYGNKFFKGSYYETLINQEVLRKDPYGVNCYAAYLYGDKPLISIKNLNCNNNKRVLVLKDSKANVVNAHFASCVEYLDIIDLRHFDDSLKDYIEETNPDVVLTIYSPFSAGEFYEFD